MLFQDQFTTLGTNNDALKGGERTSAQMMSIYPDARATVLQFLCFSKVRSNIDLLAYVKENNATLNFPEKVGEFVFSFNYLVFERISHLFLCGFS